MSIEQFPESYINFAKISEGEKTVFNCEYHYDDEARAYDGGYSDYVNFQIDSSLNNFDINDEALLLAKVTYTKSCFCYLPDTPEKNVFPTGTISGKKLSDNRWEISFNVTFYGDENINFRGIFKLKEN